MLNIGIIDSFPMSLSLYKAHFKKLENTNCILATETIQDFIKNYRIYMNIDIVFLDFEFMVKDDYDSVNLLKSLLPKTKINLLLYNENRESIKNVFDTVGVACIYKDLTFEEFKNEINHILPTKDSIHSSKIINKFIKYRKHTEIIDNPLCKEC